MGSFYVDAVLNGLKGREFSLRIGGTQEKPKMRNFSSLDLAFLLTIAARQPNPGSMEGDLDPICFGDAETLQSLMHIKSSVFFEARNFLQKLELIQFRNEEIHVNPKNPDQVRRYTNVYRIGIKKLRELQPDVETWRKQVLKIGDSAEIPEGVMRSLLAYESMPCSDEVRNVESGVRKTEPEVRNTDTNTITDTLEKLSKNTLYPSAIDESFVDNICRIIAEKLGCSRKLVRDVFVEKAIKGKYSETVLKTLADLGRNKNTKWVFSADNPVASVVSVLRKLPPEQSDPEYRRKFNPTPEQILETVPSVVVRETVQSAIAATGCEDRRVVDQLVKLVTRAKESSSGISVVYDAIEALGKQSEIKCPELRACWLIDNLSKRLQ